tara:strand:+ start:59707 stop:61008 length:1302 start_codon:yes stop_codon:yes gene_type:complete
MSLSSVARHLVLATTAMVAIGSANAQFDFNYNDFSDQFEDQFDRDFDRDFRRGHHQDGQKMRIAEPVNQQFGPGFSALPVAKLLKLRQYTGYELKKIILVAETERSFGRGNGPIRDRRDIGRPGRGHGRMQIAEATLLIDGAPQGYPQMISQFKDRIVLDVTDRNSTIGHDLSRVRVELRGSVHVYRVAAVIEKTRGGHGPRTQQVTERVGQYFNEFSNLKVIRELKLAQHKGKDVMEVTVKAEDMSRRGRATAQLLVNGRHEGFSQSINRGNVTFRLDRGLTLGDEIRTIQVQFKGEVYVQSVSATLKAARGGNGPGPRPPRNRNVIEETVYQRINGDQLMDVASALRATSSEARSEVRRIEVVVNNSGMNGQMRLCKGRDVRGSSQCTDTARLGFGRSTVTLQGDRFMTLQQATLSARGNMIIESIKVVLN